MSKEDQNLELQLQALKEAKSDRIFSDKKSGLQKRRKGLEEAMSNLWSGDTLVVWKLDRLDRTVKQLVDLITGLSAKGVNFKSQMDGIDTTTSAGRFFFHIMPSLAQMECELISERTKAGLAAGKRFGRLGGSCPVMSDGKISSARKLLGSGMLPRAVAEDLGILLPTLYRGIPETASSG